MYTASDGGISLDLDKPSAAGSKQSGVVRTHSNTTGVNLLMNGPGDVYKLLSYASSLGLADKPLLDSAYFPMSVDLSAQRGYGSLGLRLGSTPENPAQKVQMYAAPAVAALAMCAEQSPQLMQAFKATIGSVQHGTGLIIAAWGTGDAGKSLVGNLVNIMKDELISAVTQLPPVKQTNASSADAGLSDIDSLLAGATTFASTASQATAASVAARVVQPGPRRVHANAGHAPTAHRQQLQQCTLGCAAPPCRRGVTALAWGQQVGVQALGQQAAVRAMGRGVATRASASPGRAAGSRDGLLQKPAVPGQAQLSAAGRGVSMPPQVAAAASLLARTTAG